MVEEGNLAHWSCPKYQKQGSLSGDLFSGSSGDQKSKVKVCSGLAPSKVHKVESAPALSWLLVAGLQSFAGRLITLPLYSHGILVCVCVSVSRVPFYKDTGLTGSGPIWLQCILILTNYVCNNPVIRFLRYWGRTLVSEHWRSQLTP